MLLNSHILLDFSNIEIIILYQGNMSNKINWNKLQFTYKFKENKIQIIENNLIP